MVLSIGNGQQIKVDQGHGPDPVPVQHVQVDHKDTDPQAVTEHIAVEQNVGHATVHNQHVVPEHPKVSVQVPPHVQQVVTQVSQHVPVVPVQQHVAKQRSLRAIMDKAGKCGFKCAETDKPICASNGRCHLQFENQCELSVHNCLNAHKSKYL